MSTMHPAYQAALNVTRESFAMLRDAVDGLPGEALAWKPAPGTNSLAVLVAHSITATEFWVDAGAGQPRSIAAYRSGERAASFAAGPASAASLQGDIDRCIAGLAETFARGTEADLLAVVEWPGVDDAPKATGYECLHRAIGHLREHGGQAQLMRDLWAARS